jgi:hypothetical protein
MVAIHGPKPKTVRVNITVPENTLYQIDAVEKKQGLSRILLNDFPLAMNCRACDTFIRKMDVLNEDRHLCIWIHCH